MSSPARCGLPRAAGLGVWLLLLSATGCHARGGGRDGSIDAPASTRVEIIRRTASYPDDGLVVRGLGRLEIAARWSDRPTQVLEGTEVSLRIGGGVRRGVTDARGLVAFDSVPAGWLALEARRVGMIQIRTGFALAPGCRADVELYLATSVFGIDPPPSMPSRVVVTTCD